MDDRIDQNAVRLGVYSVTEAAHYVNAHPQTVRSWFRPSRESSREPLFLSDYAQMTDQLVISFSDLVDVHVAARLREGGVSMQHVRKVYEKLAATLGCAHPFCYKKLYVHNGKVFAGVARDMGDDALVEVLSDQSFIQAVMKPHLKQIDYDAKSLMARRWRIADGILLDPRIRMGAPLVAGTRIPAITLARAFEAEDRDAEYVAQIYGVAPEDVAHAVAFATRAGGRKAA